jgi:hypothetical protein
VTNPNAAARGKAARAIVKLTAYDAARTRSLPVSTSYIRNKCLAENNKKSLGPHVIRERSAALWLIDRVAA